MPTCGRRSISGPMPGWVSVEPTPPVGHRRAGRRRCDGALGGNRVPRRRRRPLRRRRPRPPPRVPECQAPRRIAGRQRPPPRACSRAPAQAPGHGSAWWAVLVVLPCRPRCSPALAVWARRRRRAVHEAALGADERVVRAWERAVVALRRQGLARRPDETPAEFAVRVRRRPGERAHRRSRQMRWPTSPDWSSWRVTRPGRARRPRPPAPTRWPRRSWRRTDRTGAGDRAARREKA